MNYVQKATVNFLLGSVNKNLYPHAGYKKWKQWLYLGPSVMINHNEWTEKASHKCTQLQMRFIIYQTGNVELVSRRWHSRIIDTVMDQPLNSHKQFHVLESWPASQNYRPPQERFSNTMTRYEKAILITAEIIRGQVAPHLIITKTATFYWFQSVFQTRLNTGIAGIIARNTVESNI